MKLIAFAATALALGSSSVGRAEPGSFQARFAAVSPTNGQGVRAIISNVAETGSLAPCQVQVSFFGADGSPIGEARTVQLKAGELTAVPVSRPSKMVRAILSIGEAGECELRTSVEIFDVQTGITFVSIPGEAIGGNNERTSSRKGRRSRR